MLPQRSATPAQLAVDRAHRLERALRRIFASLRTGEPPFEILLGQLAEQHDLEEEEILEAWRNTPLGRWIDETDDPSAHFRVCD